MTTDYSGNLIKVHEPKNCSEMSKSRAHLINSGSKIINVSCKVKDIDDNTKNFVNQIFSSVKVTPTKDGKKNECNDN